METLFTALLLLFGLSFGYGFACWLLQPDRRNLLIVTLTTLGLSLGILTLVMFWIALLLPGRLSLGRILCVCSGAAAFGLWLSRGRWSPWPAFESSRFQVWRIRPILLVLATVVPVISAGILFNAFYWPFVDWDALAIYAPLAKITYQTRALPFDFFYSGYPMLVPLSYAYSHWISGSLNEHWARLIPAIMAVGGIGAAATLARELRGQRAAWIAAGLVALTPLYDRWASSGYTDVPVGFYFALSALFANRWRSSRAWQDAALTGTAAGLAMWTKNDALTLLVTLPLVTTLLFTNKVEEDGQRATIIRHAAIAAGTSLAVAGPWYLRNALVFGEVIPPTAWVARAQPTFDTPLAFIKSGNQFGAPGWLFFSAMLYGVACSAVEKHRPRSDWILLLFFIAPYFAAWWLLASYDVRFLVTLVPLLGAAASMMVDDGLNLASAHLSRLVKPWAVLSAALLILAMFPAAILKTVDAKGAILHDPWMSDTAKHRLRLGGIYELALAINQLPTGSEILGLPSLSRYHIDLDRLGAIDQSTPDAPPWDYSNAYDFAVYHFDSGERPVWTHAVHPIFTSMDGYAMYATHDD